MSGREYAEGISWRASTVLADWNVLSDLPLNQEQPLGDWVDLIVVLAGPLFNQFYSGGSD
jgi:hypothetical protein